MTNGKQKGEELKMEHLFEVGKSLGSFHLTFPKQ